MIGPAAIFIDRALPVRAAVDDDQPEARHPPREVEDPAACGDANPRNPNPNPNYSNPKPNPNPNPKLYLDPNPNNDSNTNPPQPQH